MMKSNISEIQSSLQQISDVLLINGGLLCNPGLYAGDMGLVLLGTSNNTERHSERVSECPKHKEIADQVCNDGEGIDVVIRSPLFFTRYARYTQNDLYLDYAYDLTGKLQNNIDRKTPIDYKDGLIQI